MVTVASFYIGKFEVTQAQWRAVMGTNPSTFTGDDRPVENVSWGEAVEFCRRLSRETGRNYRLPTEAEWEYAARGGTSTPFAFGASLSSLKANFDGGHPYGRSLKSVFRETTTAVGSFEANSFGLYDMHGNVSEWCQDHFHTSYDGAPSRGLPPWSTPGQTLRVIRGGSWRERAEEIRSASRVGKWEGTRANSIGFRVASDSPN